MYTEVCAEVLKKEHPRLSKGLQNPTDLHLDQWGSYLKMV